MSDVETVEVATEEATTNEAVVHITVTPDSFRYDSNMSIPEMIFWLEAVKKLAIEKSLGSNSEEG